MTDYLHPDLGESIEPRRRDSGAEAARIEYQSCMGALLTVLRSMDRFKPHELPSDGRNLQVARHLLEISHALLQNDYSVLQGNPPQHPVEAEIRALQEMTRRLQVEAPTDGTVTE